MSWLIWATLQTDIRKLEEEFTGAAEKIDGDIKAVYLDICEKLQKLKELENTIRQSGQ